MRPTLEGVTGIAESRVADQIEAIRAACVEGDGIDPLGQHIAQRDEFGIWILRIPIAVVLANSTQAEHGNT